MWNKVKWIGFGNITKIKIKSNRRCGKYPGKGVSHDVHRRRNDVIQQDEKHEC